MPAKAEAMIVAPSVGVLDAAPVVDSESEPFEDPSLLVDTLISESDTEPLGSLTTYDYFVRSDMESNPEEFLRRTRKGTILIMMTFLGTMSLSHISISSDSEAESVKSSASHIILSETKTMPAKAEAMIVAPSVGVLDAAPVVDSESEPFEDPSLLVDTLISESDTEPLGSLTTYDYFVRSDMESNPEEFLRRTRKGTILIMMTFLG
nr:hypothetical protein [Tanacetum cinerariifolium]